MQVSLRPRDRGRCGKTEYSAGGITEGRGQRAEGRGRRSKLDHCVLIAARENGKSH
jgi:hypothetical protein